MFKALRRAPRRSAPAVRWLLTIGGLFASLPAAAQPSPDADREGEPADADDGTYEEAEAAATQYGPNTFGGAINF